MKIFIPIGQEAEIDTNNNIPITLKGACKN